MITVASFTPRRSRLCVTSFTKLLIQQENALKRFEVAVTV